jgi:hypothetical protein
MPTSNESIQPEKLVSKEITFHVWALNACIFTFLNIPPFEFHLGVESL